MFTASIGPYLYSIVGLDPSGWSIPSYLRSRRTHSDHATTPATAAAGTAEEMQQGAVVTMHVTPDKHAVRVLGQASGTVKTMCGQLAAAWHAEVNHHFNMTASIPVRHTQNHSFSQPVESGNKWSVAFVLPYS